MGSRSEKSNVCDASQRYTERQSRLEKTVPSKRKESQTTTAKSQATAVSRWREVERTLGPISGLSPQFIAHVCLLPPAKHVRVPHPRSVNFHLTLYLSLFLSVKS